MKKLIVTRADKNIKEMTDLTHPFIKEYAEKCGADFKVLDHDTGKEYPHPYHYRIMKIGELLNDYDRILNIDSDCLIMPHAVDIFNFAPLGVCCTVFEDVGSRKDMRRELIQRSQEVFEDVGWKEGYINCGFILFDKCHQDIFGPYENKYRGQDIYWGGFGYPDIHLGFKLREKGHEVLELQHYWNHMTMFSEDWNGCADRFKSFVIHYAGQGIFDEGVESRLEQIKKDIAVREKHV